jgi:hypothetical protein
MSVGEVTLTACAAVLAAVFIQAAAGKAVGAGVTSTWLRALGVPYPMTLTTGTVAIEVTGCVLLPFFPALGAALFGLVLVCGTPLLVASARSGQSCGCSGRTPTPRPYLAVARNFVLAMLVVITIFLASDDTRGLTAIVVGAAVVASLFAWIVRAHREVRSGANGVRSAIRDWHYARSLAVGRGLPGWLRDTVTTDAALGEWVIVVIDAPPNLALDLAAQPRWGDLTARPVWRPNSTQSHRDSLSATALLVDRKGSIRGSGRVTDSIDLLIFATAAAEERRAGEAASEIVRGAPASSSRVAL